MGEIREGDNPPRGGGRSEIRKNRHWISISCIVQGMRSKFQDDRSIFVSFFSPRGEGVKIMEANRSLIGGS